MTSKVTGERPESGFLRQLRVLATIAVVAGAAVSIGFMLRVGHRNPSRILMGLFGIWVLSPFTALVLATVVSKRWSAVSRTALYTVMLVLTLGSLALYGDVALGQPRAQPAFMFLVVPLASWLLIAIVVPGAAFLSGRLSGRNGA